MEGRLDFWFKLVEFLQHNWALIEEVEKGKCKIIFMGDTGGIFDSLCYDSTLLAIQALKLNGFVRYEDDVEAQKFIACPEPPFEKREHPNGPIYSSGRHWKA